MGVRWWRAPDCPGFVTALLLAPSLTSPAFRPGIPASRNKASLLLSGFSAALAVGVLVERGWTELPCQLQDEDRLLDRVDRPGGELIEATMMYIVTSCDCRKFMARSNAAY